jgi:hypothetical protein
MNTPDDDFIEAVGNTEYAKIKSVDIDRLLRICDGRKAALAEKERSVHEKYKAELITQNDQLDRYEEQIAALEKRISDAGILKLAAENAALTARIKELEDDIRELMKYATGEVTAQKEGV